MSVVCEGSLDLDKVGYVGKIFSCTAFHFWNFKSVLLSYFLQANMWLGTLLLDHSDDIYRMKGLLSVDGMNERFVFQVSTVSAFLCLNFYMFHIQGFYNE